MSDDPCGRGGEHDWKPWTYTNTDGKKVTVQVCSKCEVED